MNQLYNVMSGIWDTILSFPFVGDEAKRKGKLGMGLTADLGRVTESKDPAKAMLDSDSWKEMMKALQDAAGDPSKKGQFDEAIKAMASKIGADRLGSAAKMAGVDPKKIEEYLKQIPQE